MSRLVGRLAVAVFVACTVFSVGASPSRAEPIAPYLNTAAATEDALWYRVSVTGTAWPDTFPASWAAPSAQKVSVAANALPALRVLGTLSLAPTAFQLGWKIGRTIDTKWLHLSGDVGTVPPSGAVTGAKYIFYSTTSAAGQVPANVWRLQVTAGANYSDYCNPGADPACARPQSVWNYVTAMEAAGYVTLVNVSGAGGPYCKSSLPSAPTCSVAYMDEAVMEAALTPSFPVPYTNQPFDRSTSIPAPVKNETNLAAARNKITELGEAVQNEYNASLDPANWARPGPNGSPPGGLIRDWTMPECRGLIVAACQSAISSAAADANAGNVTFSESVASKDAADLGLGAGVTISTAPAASSVGRPPAVTITRNPDPLPLVWPVAVPSETYDQYVARLRGLGWLGSATVSGLNGLEGDPRYGVGGIPCTSSQPSTRIWPHEPATFFQNPSMAEWSEHGSGGGSCGGGFATPASGDCEFNDAISNEKGTWDENREEWGPYVLDTECAEAWLMMRALGVLNVDGTLTSAAIQAAEEMDLRILNPVLQAELPQHGAALEFWRKVYLDRFGGISFVTPSGHRFELHFYRDVASNVYIERDFKLVFLDWFH